MSHLCKKLDHQKKKKERKRKEKKKDCKSDSYLNTAAKVISIKVVLTKYTDLQHFNNQK